MTTFFRVALREFPEFSAYPGLLKFNPIKFASQTQDLITSVCLRLNGFLEQREPVFYVPERYEYYPFQICCKTCRVGLLVIFTS